MKPNTLARLFGSVMGLGATIALFIIDWRIGLLVFLMIWGHTLEQHLAKG